MRRAQDEAARLEAERFVLLALNDRMDVYRYYVWCGADDPEIKSPTPHTTRLRRETAAELASRRVARALLQEWVEYRREEGEGQGPPRDGAGAAAAVGVDPLPLRAKTMRTLYPRLQRELLRLLPVGAAGEGGLVDGEGRGGSGWETSSGEGWADAGGW